jgi:hypothetical protein
MAFRLRGVNVRAMFVTFIRLPAIELRAAKTGASSDRMARPSVDVGAHDIGQHRDHHR